jgi:hypothetical protein
VRISSFVVLMVAGAILVLPGAANAAVFLDTHDPGGDRFTPVKRTEEKLAAGKPYVVTVKGTFSLYNRSWVRPRGRCGTPLRRPQFRSRGVENGPVGADAVFVFAEKRRQCRLAGGTPYTWAGLQVAVGGRYSELDGLLHDLTGPRADHAYRFAVTGRGARMRIRMRDPNTQDNYGRLRFTLRRARPDECGRFLQWGFDTEPECIVAAGGTPPPDPPA